jgi:DNA-binding CsgD family transcriptional regulator
VTPPVQAPCDDVEPPADPPGEVLSESDLGSAEWLACLGELTRSLGHKSFEARLVELLNRVLPVDHCVVFTHGDDGVGHLFTHGKMPAARAQQLADDYVRQYHAHDPVFRRLTADAKADAGEMRPLDLDRDYDPAYRNHFFDRNDLVDKTATIGRVEQGAVLCNFYRMGGSGPYSSDDRRRLERILPLVTAYIAAHSRLVRNSTAPDSAPPELRRRTRSLVHTIVGKRVAPFDRLTAREREVCERIVLGYTSIGIGLDLQIALSSVLTYRKRAYAKLGIGTQNELFALCLDAARRP